MIDYEVKMTHRLFHAAIARLMEITNLLQKTPIKAGFDHLLKGLYPFAPHLTAEIWEKLYKADIRQGKENYDEILQKCQKTKEMELKVSVNGKFVGTVKVP